MIGRNPAEHVSGPRTPTVEVDDTLTADEARAALAAAEGDAELGALWWLALSYGLRLSELLDLRWSDVAGGELTVRRSKTAAGVRTLPLTDDAKRVLRRTDAASRSPRSRAMCSRPRPATAGPSADPRAMERPPRPGRRRAPVPQLWIRRAVLLERLGWLVVERPERRGQSIRYRAAIAADAGQKVRDDHSPLRGGAGSGG